ncbi:DUF6588 family protein [Natronoflexus pectinivorans]|uniref:DUF6588 family protein n=1 Tax=Natronoflexus pectinivorans TaxID=682526 RepID=UPI001043950E|nr:DUF6588 family protein [Natronoflexus pectinivorans]
MKLIRSFLLLGAGFIFSLNVSYAQKDVTRFLEMGIEDATILSEAYLKPYGEMLGTSLNGGWYTSARVHRVAGFNLTFNVNMVSVPSSGKSFDLNNLEGNWRLQDENVSIAPTIAGKMSDRPVLLYGPENAEQSFEMPNGTGFDRFPLPLLQIGVGLPYRTEVSARIIPTISAGDAGKVNLWGFGVRHSVKEYIPVIRHMPLINSSVLVGYTRFGSDVSVQQFGEGSNQSLDISSGALTTRFLLGVNIPFISIYTGMGYNSTNSDFDLKGDYGPVLGNDPISLSYKTNGFDFNAGMRLRLGVIAFHGDYTVGDYSMLTFGVGINMR